MCNCDTIGIHYPRDEEPFITRVTHPADSSLVQRARIRNENERIISSFFDHFQAADRWRREVSVIPVRVIRVESWPSAALPLGSYQGDAILYR